MDCYNLLYVVVHFHRQMIIIILPLCLKELTSIFLYTLGNLLLNWISNNIVSRRIQKENAIEHILYYFPHFQVLSLIYLSQSIACNYVLPIPACEVFPKMLDGVAKVMTSFGRTNGSDWLSVERQYGSSFPCEQCTPLAISMTTMIKPTTATRSPKVAVRIEGTFFQLSRRSF